MIALQNLGTGELQRVSGPVTITSEDLLLIHGESSKDLSDLQALWTKEFPGKSHLLSSLRSDLIRADWLRRRARAVLQQVQLDVYLTGLPMPHWDRFTQQQVRFLEKHAAHTQSEFSKALRLLFNCKPAPVKAEPAAPPPKRESDPRALLQQMVKVSVADGKVLTESDLTPQEFLRPELMEKVAEVWRLFCFHDAIVPAEYAYTLRHQDIDYEPTTSILISYEPEDFKDICQREIETASPHCLDGKRSGYHHMPDIQPVEF